LRGLTRLPLEPHAVDSTAAACAAPFAARSAAKFAATSPETSWAELAHAPGRVLLLAIPVQADRAPPGSLDWSSRVT
jgi:hypothetical protein